LRLRESLPPINKTAFSALRRSPTVRDENTDHGTLHGV
jgi:hypothetical protein